RADVILDYLYRTVRLGHPLANSLAAAGNAECGGVGAKLTVLAEVLQQGKTLGQALPLAVPEIRSRDVAAISAAEESGNLLPALKRLVAARSAWDFSNELNISYGIYLLLVAIVAIVVLIIDLIFGQPIYRYFFPPLWYWNFDSETSSFFGESIQFIPLVLFVIILIFSVTLLNRFLFPNFGHLRSFRWLRDWLVWYIPFFGAIVWWQTWANVTAILHEYARAGDELTSAVESAANSGINNVARRRLLRWKKKMEKGRSPKAAALSAGLPRLLCSNLDEATGSTFAGSLGFVHAIYQRRFEQSVALVRGALIPTTVIFLGIIVLLTMLLLFQPYISVMKVLEYGGPL
ncbi:MAG TPA: type II secretion system F family protein, partial [Phycisphaerae bacterium]|nr:type II secretion system F family protein [Phycisphaerae bacterium]